MAEYIAVTNLYQPEEYSADKVLLIDVHKLYDSLIGYLPWIVLVSVLHTSFDYCI